MSNVDTSKLNVNMLFTELIASKTAKLIYIGDKENGDVSSLQIITIHCARTNTVSNDPYAILRSLVSSFDVKHTRDTTYWQNFYAVGRHTFNQIYNYVCDAATRISTFGGLSGFLTHECIQTPKTAITIERLAYPPTLARLFDGCTHCKNLTIGIKSFLEGVPGCKIESALVQLDNTRLLEFAKYSEYEEFVKIVSCMTSADSEQDITQYCATNDKVFKYYTDKNTRLVALLWMLTFPTLPQILAS